MGKSSVNAVASKHLCFTLFWFCCDIMFWHEPFLPLSMILTISEEWGGDQLLFSPVLAAPILTCRFDICRECDFVLYINLGCYLLISIVWQ